MDVVSDSKLLLVESLAPCEFHMTLRAVRILYELENK